MGGFAGVLFYHKTPSMKLFRKKSACYHLYLTYTIYYSGCAKRCKDALHSTNTRRVPDEREIINVYDVFEI